MFLVLFQKINRIVPGLALLICLTGIVILQSKQYSKSINQLNTHNYLQQEEELERLINVQKHIPSLGFDNLVADWSYLNFVQYFGNKPARDLIGYKLVPNYFETIRDRDPRFTQAYLKLAVANSIYAGNPEKTVALMEEVLQAVSPQSAQASLLWTSKGLDELLFLGDTKAAHNSYGMAAQWARLQGNNIDDTFIANNLKTALFLAGDPDTKEAQIMAWSTVLPNIKDNQKRQEIIEKINGLKVEIIELEATTEKVSIAK
jgi:hypothetical protein